MNIRNITLEDATEICRIYNYYIENTCITFETAPVPVTEMVKRIQEVLQSDFPFYVAEKNGEIIGYANMHNWNGRSAYSSTREVSIYLDNKVKGKGYGTQLYRYLLDHINKETTHALIAGICIPNEASVRLHEKFGFRQVSHFKEIGWKFNAWRDVGHWQLILT